MSKKDFIESVFLALDPSVSAKEIQKAANVSYQKLPKDDKAFLALCEKLLEVTPTYIKYISLWIKRRKLYDFSYFVVYEQWLKTYVDGWAWCDQFCYRVLNPMLEQHYTQVKEHVFAWCHDANVLDVYKRQPLGSSYPIHENRNEVLLIGGGVGVPPLYELAKQMCIRDRACDIRIVKKLRIKKGSDSESLKCSVEIR